VDTNSALGGTKCVLPRCNDNERAREKKTKSVKRCSIDHSVDALTRATLDIRRSETNRPNTRGMPIDGGARDVFHVPLNYARPKRNSLIMPHKAQQCTYAADNFYPRLSVKQCLSGRV